MLGMNRGGIKCLVSRHTCHGVDAVRKLLICMQGVCFCVSLSRTDGVQKLLHFILLSFRYRNEACAFHYVDLDRQNDTLIWDDVFGLWHWKSGA